MRIFLSRAEAKALRQAAHEIQAGEMDEDHGWTDELTEALETAITKLWAVPDLEDSRRQREAT